MAVNRIKPTNHKNMELTNRRMFLKALAASGAIMATTGMPWLKVLAKEGDIGANAANRVRLGFIGIGSRGSALLRNIIHVMKKNNIDVAAFGESICLCLIQVFGNARLGMVRTVGFTAKNLPAHPTHGWSA